MRCNNLVGRHAALHPLIKDADSVKGVRARTAAAVLHALNAGFIYTRLYPPHPSAPGPHRPAMIGCLLWLMYPSENFIMSFACGAVRQVAGSCPSLQRSCSGLNWHCRRSLSRKPSSRLPSFAPHCFNTVVLTSDNVASVSLFSLFTA